MGKLVADTQNYPYVVNNTSILKFFYKTIAYRVKYHSFLKWKPGKELVKLLSGIRWGSVGFSLEDWEWS